MSPRAACRLDTLGFEHVYDYVPGKADWLAHGLPVERRDELITAGQLARADVVTCRLTDTIGDLAARIADSAYGFALVTSRSGVLLGRLRASALNVPPDTPAEQAMENGPSTVRPDTPADELARRLRARDLTTAILTTPEAELIGIARRADLEQH
ncbi:MAG: CBS domain-containing protein [Solirubrobacteraceae bacterium]